MIGCETDVNGAFKYSVIGSEGEWKLSTVLMLSVKICDVVTAWHSALRTQRASQ